jgi:hypothetical protein
MFTPRLQLFYLSFIYIFLLFISTTFICFRSPKNIPNSIRNIFLILLLSIIIRIIPVFFFPFGSGFDIESFTAAGLKIIQKTDIYWGLDVRYRFSFLPTWAIIMAGIISISKNVGLPAYILMKLVIVLFDSCIPFLLFHITKKALPSLYYAICPIPIIISAYLGQFEAVILFFLLISFIDFTKKNYVRCFLFLGISFAIKPWPIIFFLPILFMSKSYVSSFTFLFFPGFILFIYKYIIPDGNLLTMAAAIMAYESVIGWWGPSIFVNLFAQIIHKNRIITISGLISKTITIILLIRNSIRLDTYSIFLIAKSLILIIYIFSYGLGIHYLLWILPFSLITQDKMTKLYMFIGGLYFCLMGTFHLLTYQFIPPGIPILYRNIMSFLFWIFFVVWGIQIFTHHDIHGIQER